MIVLSCDFHGLDTVCLWRVCVHAGALVWKLVARKTNTIRGQYADTASSALGAVPQGVTTMFVFADVFAGVVTRFMLDLYQIVH